MPTKKKVNVVFEEPLPKFFDNPEFSSPADRLLEAIRQYYSRIEGKNVGRTKLLGVANKILENRS